MASSSTQSQKSEPIATQEDENPPMFKLGGVSYALIQRPLLSHEGLKGNDSNKKEGFAVFHVCTCFTDLCYCPKITGNYLTRYRSRYITRDDVFHEKFLKTVIFVHRRSNEYELEDSAKNVLRSWGIKEDNCKHLYAPDTFIPRGPYVFYKGKVWQPFRIYVTSSLLRSNWPVPRNQVGDTLTGQEDSSLDNDNTKVIVPYRYYRNYVKKGYNSRLVFEDMSGVEEDSEAMKAFLRDHARYCVTAHHKCLTDPNVQHIGRLGVFIVGVLKRGHEPPPCLTKGKDQFIGVTTWDK